MVTMVRALGISVFTCATSSRVNSMTCSNVEAKRRRWSAIPRPHSRPRRRDDSGTHEFLHVVVRHLAQHVEIVFPDHHPVRNGGLIQALTIQTTQTVGTRRLASSSTHSSTDSLVKVCSSGCNCFQGTGTTM